MRVLLSTCGSRGDAEPMVGLAVRLRALGTELLTRRAAELVAAISEVEMAEEPEWGLRCGALGIHSLSRMGVR